LTGGRLISSTATPLSSRYSIIFPSAMAQAS
jgi:hypothetical protein